MPRHETVQSLCLESRAVIEETAALAADAARCLSAAYPRVNPASASQQVAMRGCAAHAACLARSACATLFRSQHTNRRSRRIPERLH